MRVGDTVRPIAVKALQTLAFDRGEAPDAIIDQKLSLVIASGSGREGRASTFRGINALQVIVAVDGI